VVDSSFSCAEGANGSQISSCTDQNGRSAAAPLDTSTSGAHSFMVTATSSDGLTSSSTVVYYVAAPPVASFTRPQNGTVYVLGQSVTTTFGCAEGTGGPGLVSCVDERGHGPGTPLDTATLGTHNVAVTATSADGQVTIASATYTVVVRPSVSEVKVHHWFVTFNIALPSEGAVDAIATASFKGSRRTVMYGRSDIYSFGSGTIPMILIPGKAGQLALRQHGSATIRLTVAYTASAASPQKVVTLVLKVRR
jgi:hypothetical protein